MKKLYPHQQETLREMCKNYKGIIAIPTGTGKSLIQNEYVIDKFFNQETHQICVIVAPRIVLCQQLLSGLYVDYLSKETNFQEVLTFSSIGQVPNFQLNDGTIIVGSEIGRNTTEVSEITADISIAKDEGKNNIIFTTYHSFDKVIKAIKKIKDQNSECHLLADECHYFVRGNVNDEDEEHNENAFVSLRKNLNLFKSRFFFTATPLLTDRNDDFGMNNEEVYGKTIYNKTSLDMIKLGIICPAKANIFDLPSHINSDNISEYAHDIIFDAFFEHEKVINEECGYEPLKGELGAKIIVACEGSKQVRSLMKNGFLEEAKKHSINVIQTMCHEEVGTKINGVPFKMDGMIQWLQDFNKQLGVDKQRLIILQYDRLIEGIDVPSLTGELILRKDMPKYKAIQFIGRGARVNELDKKKSIGDKTRVKNCVHILLPKVENYHEDFKEILKFILDNGFDPSSVVEKKENPIGLDQEDDLEMQNRDFSLYERKILGEDIRLQIENYYNLEKLIQEQFERKEPINDFIENRMDW